MTCCSGDLPLDWSYDSRSLSELTSDTNGIAASQHAICFSSDAY